MSTPLKLDLTQAAPFRIGISPGLGDIPALPDRGLLETIELMGMPMGMQPDPILGEWLFERIELLDARPPK